MANEWRRLYHDSCELHFRKGNEGSRGGQVIGHTKSGKPIYGHSSGVYKKQGNAVPHAGGVEHAYDKKHKYSEQDHQDAETAHTKSGIDAFEEAAKLKNDNPKKAHLIHQMRGHFKAANLHTEVASKMSNE